MRILIAAQTALGDWIEGGEGRTLLVEALDSPDSPIKGLPEWLSGAERQLPITIKQRYPDLKEEDVQLPELLDFAQKSQPAA
jgi:hypothetical protein